MPSDATKPLPVGKGGIELKVSSTFPLPAGRVWEAATKATHVQGFFVDKVEGDFTPALTPVFWLWKKWGRHTLWPIAVQEGKGLEFRWQDHSGRYLTTVTFTLRRKGKSVELEIRERGWRRADLANALDNASGWTMFLDYLKAYLVHGIDLRA